MMKNFFLFEILAAVVLFALILYVLYHWIEHHYLSKDHFFSYLKHTKSGAVKKKYEPPKILYPSFYDIYEQFAKERFYEGLNLQAELLSASGKEKEALITRIKTFNREQEAFAAVWDRKFAEQGFDRRKGDFSRLGTILLLE